MHTTQRLNAAVQRIGQAQADDWQRQILGEGHKLPERAFACVVRRVAQRQVQHQRCGGAASNAYQHGFFCPGLECVVQGYDGKQQVKGQ